MSNDKSNRRNLKPASYEQWLRKHAFKEKDRKAAEKEIQDLNFKPKISILTPVYNVDPKWLDMCIKSVLAQIYPLWELVLVDDGSTNRKTINTLKKWEEKDPRLVIHFQGENRGIAGTTNTAFDLATGEFIGLMDNDDEITPDALFEVVKLLNEHPEADFIYSDEDKLELDGKRSEPFFKPDWAPELLRSYAYTNHFAVYRKTIIEAAGKYREEFHGAQDYDLTLRVVELTKNIFHIPKVLYHWRKIAGSAAEVVDAKGYALQRAGKALAEHVERSGFKAEVISARNAPGCFRVKYEIQDSPKVSVLIPTRGQINRENPRAAKLLMRCIRSIAQKTDYHNYELVICYNNYMDPEIEEFFSYRPHKLINYTQEGDFNFAHKMNFMASQATGDHFVIFNDDLEIIAPDWMSALLEFSQQEEVGTVGSKLLYPDGRLQHVGMVLGINGYPAHLFHQAPPNHPGYMAHANLIRNYSATTGAAMMVSRKIWEEVGGLDDTFAIDYNDVDFCLRVMEAGYRNVYTPYSLMYHHESAELSGNRLKDAETAAFKERWQKYLDNDPLYNPNLTRRRFDCSLDH